MILRKFLLVGTETGLDGRPFRSEKTFFMEARHVTPEWKARYLAHINNKQSSMVQGEHVHAIGKREGLEITMMGDYQLEDLGLFDNFGNPIIEEVKKPATRTRTKQLEYDTETATETV